ncbi:hypothetical protein N5P37_003548 [Trichoderma harzianum]|nr:hypothetical protein N5P37_003548 [Trichoderma harzianum]
MRSFYLGSGGCPRDVYKALCRWPLHGLVHWLCATIYAGKTWGNDAIFSRQHCFLPAGVSSIPRFGYQVSPEFQHRALNWHGAGSPSAAPHHWTAAFDRASKRQRAILCCNALISEGFGAPCQVAVLSGGASAPPAIVANPKPTYLLCYSGREDGSWPVSKQTLRNSRASAHTSGSLQYENGTQIKIDITGTVDKGFFLAEGEWTCYRRNYMTCACSYSLHPHYPNTAVHFIPPGSTQAYQVFGLYMSISAVVADNDQQSIELVQHTPKRDKGPTSKPEKVQLAPKNSVPSHHGIYNDPASASGARAMYQDGYGGQAAVQPATEHTFERIQFKQATQNNGKRRAAQQYYHLMVELWADLGSSFSSQSSDKYFKIAFRKSEKMIVRGRSPGHYQNEKRRSHSGGPGGSSGTMGGYGSLTNIGEFSSHSGIIGGNSTYGNSYDSRGSVYGTPRSHDVPSEATIPSEDDKVMANTKGYLYYPGPMYDNSHSRPMEMFGTRSDQETSPSQSSTDTKVKSEYDVTPRVFHPPLTENRRHPGPFEGKSTSGGYYPTILSSPTTSLTL